jgi:hypothetical protein
VRTQKPVASVKLVPSNQEIPFEQQDGAVRFSVPELLCHQMVEVAY